MLRVSALSITFTTLTHHASPHHCTPIPTHPPVLQRTPTASAPLKAHDTRHSLRSAHLSWYTSTPTTTRKR